MHVISTASDYDALYQQWVGQSEGQKKIALIPTMGALHAGHLALVRLAQQLADVVVVSIFVNPLQFGPQEDLSRYPRPLEQDLALCRELGVDAVFTPTVDVLYPEGMDNMTTLMPPASLTDRFCGEFRPGHFTGVATVVLKLFNLLRPQFAVFGEKDAQQLMVIRKMVQDLHVPVQIVPHSTIRESSGLALSSRNRYLKTEAEQRAALYLYETLSRVREKAQQALTAGHALDAESTLLETSQAVCTALAEPDVSIRLQYMAAVDKDTFAPLNTLEANAKLLMAAYVNKVRLIDNLDLA